MDNIGKKIRRERKRKKLNQIKLAREVGISNTYLSDIEIGRTVPSLKTLERISQVLDVDIKLFL